MWSQVLYHRLDSTFITEALGIVAPFAAHSNSFSQVTPKTYVSLEKRQKMDYGDRHVFDATSSSENDHCMCTLYRKPVETLHFWENMPRIHNNSLADNMAFRNIQKQDTISRSEQLSCACVTAFSRTSLFLERFWRKFWMYFKLHKPVCKSYRPKKCIFCLLIKFSFPFWYLMLPMRP